MQRFSAGNLGEKTSLYERIPQILHTLLLDYAATAVPGGNIVLSSVVREDVAKVFLDPVATYFVVSVLNICRKRQVRQSSPLSKEISEPAIASANNDREQAIRFKMCL